MPEAVPHTPAAEADIRPFMAGFPTGVSVLTTLDENAEPRGMTCSALVGVALDPATVMVGVRTASPTLEAFLAGGQFAINLLHERARATSDLFASATASAERFARTEWRLPLGAAGPHLVSDAHAIADCRVLRTLAFGDHTPPSSPGSTGSPCAAPRTLHCSTAAAGTPPGPTPSP